ncbi:MAG: HU family DNA-binding protein [Desulfonauticus sp.]|nr:HU family DNA-binding protein [Desulfonauticus sp.]
MSRTLTKSEIIEHLCNHSTRSRSELKEIVEHLITLIKQIIKNDGSLLISGFGKFEAYQKKPRKGRNPHTNETIMLPGRKVVVFRVSKKFRAELNLKK